MKIVLQRTNSACVCVNKQVVGKIGKGYIVFLGFIKGDTAEMVDKVVDKISRLRIFADENGKTNLSASQVGGEILVVSQFTLAAELTQNRPSFSNAAEKEKAFALYQHFVESCQGKFAKVQTGQFGEHMEVSVENDGPFTLIME